MNNDEFMDFEDEENDDLIELVDDNGESVTFEHLATLTYKGETYLALADPEAEDSTAAIAAEGAVINDLAEVSAEKATGSKLLINIFIPILVELDACILAVFNDYD